MLTTALLQSNFMPTELIYTRNAKSGRKSIPIYRKQEKKQEGRARGVQLTLMSAHERERLNFSRQSTSKSHTYNFRTVIPQRVLVTFQGLSGDDPSNLLETI